MDGAIGIVLELVLVVGVDGQQLGAAARHDLFDTLGEDLLGNAVDDRAQRQFVVRKASWRVDVGYSDQMEADAVEVFGRADRPLAEGEAAGTGEGSARLALRVAGKLLPPGNAVCDAGALALGGNDAISSAWTTSRSAVPEVSTASSAVIAGPST